MRDVDHIVGQCEGLLAQSWAFCTEEQQAPLGEGIGFHRHCAGNNVEGDDAGGLKLLDACITSIDFGQQLMKVLVVSIHSHIMRMDGGGTGLGSFIGDFTGDAMMPGFQPRFMRPRAMAIVTGVFPVPPI